MLAQVLGAERERFLLGEKNTYIIEGNWPAGAKMEVRLDGHEISAKLVSGEKEEELSRSEEAVRLLGEKKKITVELPEGWEKAHKLAVYAMENGQKNVWFRIPVRELKRKQKTPQFYLDQEVIDAKAGRIHLSGWTVSRGPVKIALFDREKKKIPVGSAGAQDPMWLACTKSARWRQTAALRWTLRIFPGDAVYLVFSGKGPGKRLSHQPQDSGDPEK